MNTATSYQVLHWQLTQLNNVEPPPVDSYIVIWWQQVPLGHIWWHAKDEADLSEKIWNAIEPTVNGYSEHYLFETAEATGLPFRGLPFHEFDRLLQKHVKLPEFSDQPISIIICTRNRPEDLKKCLASLINAATAATEIVVVDNAAVDDSTKKIVSEFDGVRYIAEERPGLDIARNTGIRNASHEIVAFTDDDVVIPADWVKNLLSCFQDPITMAVTGIVLPIALDTEAQVIFEKDWGFNKGYLPKKYDHQYYLDKKNEGAPVWDIGAGANMAFRKQAFELVGLFDERLDVGAAGCSGDSEMWFRILAEGWNCCYYPHNYVFHKHRESISGLKKQLFHYMKGHACALLVQHEKYPDAGNRKRMYQRMPRYYATRFAKTKLKGQEEDPFLMTEINGFIAGHNYYRAHRNEKQPILSMPPHSLSQHKNATPGTLVSVVIPCYNHGRFLGDAIKSVIKQTHNFFEIIVVDDGSGDNTSQVCSQFGNQVKYVKVERVGLAAARNIGAAYAAGDYIVFLDADDFLYPAALEINLFFFDYYKNVVMVSGGHQKVNAIKETLPTENNHVHLGDNYAALLKGNYIAMEGAVMYRKDLFPFFHFDTRLKACEDYDLNLRIAEHYPVFGHDKIIAAYRMHGTNMSSDKSRMLASALKVLEKHRHNLDNAELKKAYDEGVLNWTRHYSAETANTHDIQNRIPASPPVIAPVDTALNRPTWSVMIPAYNCGKYLWQTIESVLKQDKGIANMQIEVVDDASTDMNIKELVDKIGRGRVSYFRQTHNVGSLRNFETCLNRATGYYVHLLHGDDYVDDGFYTTVERLFTKFPSAGAACTGFTEVNDAGTFIADSRLAITSEKIPENWLEIISRQQMLQPPAVVVKRSVYETIGGFYGVEYGEDWEMWVRIASNFPVAHSPEKLAHYRVHGQNISSASLLSGKHLRDIKNVINEMQAYLPADSKSKMKADARRNWSHYFARTSDKTYGMYKKPKLALKQSFNAFKMHQNKITVFYLIKTLVKVSLGLKPATRKH